MLLETIQGCLAGLAIGDALGAATEFMDIATILKTYPPNGPQQLTGNPALVTDDTQMALAVADALVDAPYPYQLDTLAKAFEREFLRWYHSPDNNRAPGMTCMRACEHLEAGQAWLDASQINSKGCGANMRVMPVGLLSLDSHTRSGIAQLQAAITHCHPTALAASDLTAFCVHYLGTGGHPQRLFEATRQYAVSQREDYHTEWLDNLWRRQVAMSTEKEFIAQGWDECLAVLEKLNNALRKQDRLTDPCLQTGAGWIAEEAFATALLCFLLFPDDPLAVIRRAALTSGDSDSIACIAGAFAGACYGLTAWPPDWVIRVEYQSRILEVAAKLDARNQELGELT